MKLAVSGLSGSVLAVVGVVFKESFGLEKSNGELKKQFIYFFLVRPIFLDGITFGFHLIHDQKSHTDMNHRIGHVVERHTVANEPIYHNGEIKGWVTSGGYAHHSAKSVALGYVPAEIADESSGWTIDIIGQRRNATLQAQPLFDPENLKMRS